jgi:hypothetical protein
MMLGQRQQDPPQLPALMPLALNKPLMLAGITRVNIFKAKAQSRVYSARAVIRVTDLQLSLAQHKAILNLIFTME